MILSNEPLNTIKTLSILLHRLTKIGCMKNMSQGKYKQIHNHFLPLCLRACNKISWHRKHEIMVAPDRDYLLIVVQNTMEV